MRRRFGRRRRNGGDDGGRSGGGAPADPRWLEQVVAAGLVAVPALTPIDADELPAQLAVAGEGTTSEGDRVVVSVARSGGDALVGALAAATRLHDTEDFRGSVLAVAASWSGAARRRLGVVGDLPFPLRASAAPFLAESAGEIDPEPLEPPAVVLPRQLVRHVSRPLERDLCARAIAGIAGLAAKHGGAIRGVGRSVELAFAARRVAAVRVDADGILLDTLVGGRRSERLQSAGLAEALDRLEGFLRKQLSERDGEEALRAQLLEPVAERAGLRDFRRWPLGGADLDALDLAGVDAAGRPVVVAVRRRIGLEGLGPILDAALRLAPSLPVLLDEIEPPVRLEAPALLLAAESFDPAALRVLRCFGLDLTRIEITGAGGREPSLRVVTGEAAPAPRLREPTPRPRAPERAPAPSQPPAPAAERSERPAAAAPPAARERDVAPTSTARFETISAFDLDVEPAEESPPPRAEWGRPATRPAAPERAPEAERPRFEEMSLFDLGEETATTGGDGEGGRRRRRRRGRGRGRARGEAGTASEGDADEEEEPGPVLDVAPQLEAEARPREERGRGRGRGRGRDRGRGRSDEPVRAGEAEPSERGERAERPARARELDESDEDHDEGIVRLSPDVPELHEEPEPHYEEEEGEEEGDPEQERMRRERERRRRARLAKADPVPEPVHARPARPRRVAILAHADRDSVAAAALLGRDLRLLEGIWVYPQSELMTFFRGVTPDLREDTPIHVVGFTASPARETIQTASLYRDRLVWYDHHAWPPEDLEALRGALGSEAVHVAPHARSSLPLVLGSFTRRSRFSDKLVDLVTGRFTQHDFERWGRLWWWRLGEISGRVGDRRADLEPLLVGRPSDLAREASHASPAPLPDEVAFVAARDFRLVHFGGYVLVVVPVEAGIDAALAARIARERYGAPLSLAFQQDEETLVLGGDDAHARRSLDLLGMVENLAEKHAFVEALPDADHVARFRVRELASRPERLEEVLASIAMGRSVFEG